MSTTNSVPAQSVVRMLTPAEVKEVAGGPGGYPGLGSVSEPRVLTQQETTQVAGGPMGCPGLGSKPLEAPNEG